MVNRQSTHLRLLLVGALSAFCTFLLLHERNVSAESNPQTPAELWFSWSPESKTNYVRGFLHGFEEGKRTGCSFYGKHTRYSRSDPREKLPGLVCLDSLPDFTATYFGTYVETISRYYTKYPNDREAGLPQIISELASPPALDVDQIHAKLNGSATK